MTTTPASTTLMGAAPAAIAAAATPSNACMLAAIEAAQLAQAQRIGGLCVTALKARAQPSPADLATATEILASLDLAAAVLARSLTGGVA